MAAPPLDEHPSGLDRARVRWDAQDVKHERPVPHRVNGDLFDRLQLGEDTRRRERNCGAYIASCLLQHDGDGDRALFERAELERVRVRVRVRVRALRPGVAVTAAAAAAAVAVADVERLNEAVIDGKRVELAQRLEVVLIVHRLVRVARVEGAEHRGDGIVAALQCRAAAAEEEQANRAAVRHVVAIAKDGRGRCV